MTRSGSPSSVRTACEVCGPLDPRQLGNLAAGLAVVRGHRLLLVQRALPPGQGLWSVPGGYVGEGESPREAAVRETFEETGLIAVIDALARAFHPDSARAPHFLLYTAATFSGIARAGDDARDARFFGRDEVPPVEFASTKYAVRRFIPQGGQGLDRRI